MLSRKTKYGIKALVYIAKQANDKRIAVAEISEKENISHKFLEAILVELRKVGILGSRKGKGGGYYLLQSPKDIEMSHVMRTLEGPIAMLPCVSLNYYEKCDDCPNEEECAVNHLMLQVRDKTLEILKSTTLQDLVISTVK